MIIKAWKNPDPDEEIWTECECGYTECFKESPGVVLSSYSAYKCRQCGLPEFNIKPNISVVLNMNEEILTTSEVLSLDPRVTIVMERYIPKDITW